ncbi:MAG: hypothetical protein KAT04_13950 [Methylococcales bacterium]|nr:hypothetical protein [Methylococcales bacterium]
MSVLDVIKDLFCKISAGLSDSKQESNSAEPKVEEKKQPVAKAKVEQKKAKPDVKETKAPRAKAEPKKAKPAAKKTKAPKLQVPEDSALKRHFISTLQMEIEADMPPRPTDLALKRHYDTEVQAKLADVLK